MKKLDRKIRFINFLGNLQETTLKSMPITLVIFIFTFIYSINQQNNMKFKKISYCLFGVLILLLVLYILFDGISNKMINTLEREYPLHLNVKDDTCKEIISLFKPTSNITFLQGPDCCETIVIIAIINNTYIRARKIGKYEAKEIFN